MAQYQLPLSFKVLPRIRPPKSSPAAGKLSPTKGKRKQRHMEQSDELLPPVNRRKVRPRSAEPPQINPPSNESANYPWLDTNRRDTPEDGQHQEASSPLLITFPGSSSEAASPDALNSMKAPNQMIAQSRTGGEPAATLTEVNPESGSTTGGARIWLKGVDFPMHFPLYARFGTAVVATVSLFTFSVTPSLTDFFRPTAILTFLPVFCLPRPRPAASMLRYRSIPTPTRRSMGLVLRSSTT